MNEDAEEVSIPLTVDTDQAAANIEKLQSVAESLDSTLERLQQRAVQAFNSIGMSLSGQPYRADNYAQVETFSKAVGPEELWAQSPRLGRAMGEVDVHRDEVAARVGRFADANQTAVSTLTGTALYNAYQGYTPPPGPPATLQAPQGTGATGGGAAAAAALPPIGAGAPLPASVSSPTSTPPAAVDPLTRLRADAEALDPQLQTRESHATRLFNQLALTSGDGQPVKATRYSDVRQHLSASTPEQTWDLSPALHQAVVGAEDRRATIGARVEQFATTAAFGAVATPAGATTSPAPTATPPPAATATPPPAATPAPAPAAVFDAFSSWLDAQPARPSSSSMPAIPNAFGTTAAPLPLGLGLGGGTTPQDTDRTATTFADKISSALTHSGGSVAASLTRGAFDAAGMGAAGDVVSGLARPVAGALGELFAPVAGVLAAVGVGLGVNDQSTRLLREQRDMGASIGTTSGAQPSQELAAAQKVGWDYFVSEKQSVAAAKQMGDAGLDSTQVPGALSNALAFSTMTGMDRGQATSLSTAMMTQGGLSVDQVAQAMQRMAEAAKASGVSVDRITESMKSFQHAGGSMALNVNGLAAVTHEAGPGIDTGRLLGPIASATGGQAIQAMALTGLTPSQFTAMQGDATHAGNPAQMWDAIAGVAKRYDRGMYGTQIAEQMLGDSGLVDFTGMSAPQKNTLVQKLVAQGPKAAEDYAASLNKKEAAPKSTDDWHTTQQRASQAFTSATDQAKIHVEQLGVAAAGAALRLDGLHVDNAQQARDEQKLRAALAHHDEPAANKARLDLVRDTAPGAGSPDPTKAEAYRQRLLDYQAHTDPLGYASNPAAAGTMDASTGRGFGPIPEYQLSQYRQSGLKVGGSYLNADTFHDYEMTARRTGVPLAALLAMGQAESGFNPGAIQRGGNGRGIAQFDFTPGTNATNSARWLGEAEKKLGYGAGEDPRQAAMDPRIATMAQGLYMASLGHASHGNLQQALTSYNGSGPAAQQYGHDVYAATQKIQIEIGGTVTLTHPDGKPAGTGQVKPQTHTITHTINPGRKPIAHQSYGPTDNTPPAPPPRFHRFG